MFRILLIITLLLSLLGPLAPGQSSVTPTPAQTKWITDHAIPFKTSEAGQGFEDLQPLKKLIGNARIVALGEATHGTHEFFQMKHRLTEFLATEMGFTIFAMEGNLPEAFRIGDYVRTGQGNPEQLVRGLAFWTWTTEELTNLVKWMRRFNESGKGHMQFAGFDMQLPGAAQQNTLAFLRKFDPTLASKAEQTFDAIRDPSQDFGVVAATIPGAAVAGKHLRYSAWVKTKDVAPATASLFLRAEGKDGLLKRGSLTGRPPSGTTDWTRYEIEIDVPKETVEIQLGLFMPGQGTAWMDEARLEIDGQAYSDASLDVDFELDRIKGFAPRLKNRPVPRSYQVTLDQEQAHSGKQSLRLKYVEPKAHEVIAPKKAAQMCREILTEMEKARPAYLKKAGPEEVDWAIQNARVVYQSYEWNADDTKYSREVSMADNIKWILDRAPAGSKIVLWAHNGHINRDPEALGAILDKRYGREMVVLGFTAASGEYNAEKGQTGIETFSLKAPPTESIEWYFQSTGWPRLILDLRPASKDDPASAWLTKTHDFRFIGTLGTDDQFAPSIVTQLYDGLIYFERSTASRMLKR